MIRGAAFCPHPPLLIPEVAQGAAVETAQLRAACTVAIRRVATAGTRLVVLGVGDSAASYAATERGSLAGYGVDLVVPLGSEAPGPVTLPLSLTVGAWLVREAVGPDCGAVGAAVPPAVPPAPSPAGSPAGSQTVPLGDGPVALLVMGDGSARRSVTAPGYLDERAGGFDAAIAAALRAGRPEGLRVDADLGAELLASGSPVWHAAAQLLGGASWDAELLYDAAPYGVGYFVAAWTRGG